jgi:hypothetical protein
MDMMSMTTSEILVFAELVTLAQEAQKAYKAIVEKFSTSFGVDNSEVHAFSTSSCGEYYGDGYININGQWMYHDNWGGGRDWTVDCSSAEGIYKCLRAKLLEERNLLSLIPEEERELAQVTRYFREFVNIISIPKE